MAPRRAYTVTIACPGGSSQTQSSNWWMNVNNKGAGGMDWEIVQDVLKVPPSGTAMQDAKTVGFTAQDL